MRRCPTLVAGRVALALPLSPTPTLGLVALLSVLGSSPAAAQGVPPAVDVLAEDVEGFIDALPRDRISDRPIRVVDLGGHRTGVYGVYRPTDAVQRAIVHNSDVAEIYYILEGTGTLVTGGRLVDPTPSSGSSFGTEYGPSIEDGYAREIGPGDIVFIPGGTPHWWSSLDGNLEYLIFRPDPSNVQSLR